MADAEATATPPQTPVEGAPSILHAIEEADEVAEKLGAASLDASAPSDTALAIDVEATLPPPAKGQEAAVEATFAALKEWRDAGAEGAIKGEGDRAFLTNATLKR
jgi:hypothetical protein